MRKICFGLMLVGLAVLWTTGFAFSGGTADNDVKVIDAKVTDLNASVDQLNYAMSFIDAKNYKRAQAEFKRLLKLFPDSSQAPDAQFYIGLCEENRQRFYRAFIEYQKTLNKYPQFERIQEVIDREYNIAELFFGKEKKILGMKLPPNYERAREIFRQVVAAAPFSAYADAAQYKCGLCFKYMHQYEEAILEFEKVADNYAYSPYLPLAKFEIAYAIYKISTLANNYDEQLLDSAIKAFNDFLDAYPDHERTAEAKKICQQLNDKKSQTLFYIAGFYKNQKKIKAAKIYYQDIIKNFQDTSWAAKAIAEVAKLEKTKPRIDTD
ncbi:MAG: tetratricopeptide repeat protein [Candidatus Omnitrophota bacterium]